MIPYSTPAAVLAVSIILTLLCMLSVALRFFPRRFHKSKPMVDDWLCLAALMMTIGMAIGIIAGVSRKSLGHPTPKAGRGKSWQSIEVEKLEWSLQMIQVLQLGFTKLSFVVFFRRIFVTYQKSIFSIITWVMIGVLIVWTTAFFFWILFACHGQFSRWWFKPQTCSGLEFESGVAISDCVIDCLIIFMPVPMIWTLQMNTRRKIAITIIFALGALAVILSIIRLIIYYQAIPFSKRKDTDHDLLITLTLFWCFIESTIALIAACLPIIYGLYGHRFIDNIVHFAHSLEGTLALSWRSVSRRYTRTHNSSKNTYHDMQKQKHIEIEIEMGPTTDEKRTAGKSRQQASSDSSVAPILPLYLAQPNPTQTLAVRDPDAAWAAEDVENGQIRVARTILRTDSSA